MYSIISGLAPRISTYMYSPTVFTCTCYNIIIITYAGEWQNVPLGMLDSRITDA